ncbi:MAG: hypothetical protein ACREKE_04275 [bacterium]
MKSKRLMSLYTVFALAMAVSSGLHADASPWGLRLSGGYGFSMNTFGMEGGSAIYNSGTGVYDMTPAFSADKLSPGIPSSAELLYSCTPRLQWSLGVFPIFSNPKYTSSFTYTQIPSSASDYSYIQNQSADITYLPVLLSLYFNQPMGSGFTAFAGFGLGVVPATSLTWTSTFTGTSGTNIPTGYTEYDALDAGFALRGVLGLDYAIQRRYSIFSSFRVGAEFQDLAFDQTILYGNTVSGSTTTAGQGWTGQTSDFNQWAPMLFVEGEI